MRQEETDKLCQSVIETFSELRHKGWQQDITQRIKLALEGMNRDQARALNEAIGPWVKKVIAQILNNKLGPADVAPNLNDDAPNPNQD